MVLLVAGVASREVARAFGISQTMVQMVKRAMCARAERDIRLARLKLWAEALRAA